MMSTKRAKKKTTYHWPSLETLKQMAGASNIRKLKMKIFGTTNLGKKPSCESNNWSPLLRAEADVAALCATTLLGRKSRRYTCEHCGRKCRTSNKMRGTRTICPMCEDDKRHYDRYLASQTNS